MYWKYLKYLIKHKWFVLVECYKFNEIWRGITHDLSKFLPDEFIPYARYFYGDYPETSKMSTWFKYEYCGKYRENIEHEFDIAWLKHQHRNKHHWQHWLLQEDDGDVKILSMPLKYFREMIADWKGAGRAINGKNDPTECKNWYLKNYNKIKLDKSTRLRVDLYFKI